MSPPTTTEPTLDVDVKPNLTQDDTESKDTTELNEIKPIGMLCLQLNTNDHTHSNTNHQTPPNISIPSRS